MSRRRFAVPWVATVTTGILVIGLAGCSSDNQDQPSQRGAAASSPLSPDKIPVVVNAVEPSRELLPADVSGDFGTRIASLIYRGLLRYDPKGRLVNEVAEDVSQSSPTLYTVKVRKGWVFGNGQPVTAASFVDAWNYAANPAHKQLHADHFSPISGYRAMRGLPEPDPEVPPGGTPGSSPTSSRPSASPAHSAPSSPAPTPSGGGKSGPGTVDPAKRPTVLTGLTLVNDLEFTIQLAVPDATFRDRLALLSYSPLPSAALKDPATYAAAPVGNGPYQLAGGWAPGKEARLIPNASYSGGEPTHNGGLTFRFFPDPAMTYPQLRSGRLDALDAMPLPDVGRYKSDLGFRALNQSVGATTSLVFPMSAKPWSTPDGLALRKAISRSIDRASLAGGLYAGTRAPASDLAAPVVAGYSPDLCGDTCRFDAAAAKEMVGKLKDPPTSLQIAYAADAGGLPVVEALCSQITQATGIECTGHPFPSAATLARVVAKHELAMPLLDTRRMVRPDLGGFLDPRFRADASDNPSGYDGAAAQTWLEKASATKDSEGRRQAYKEAEKAILEDLPEIPLWYVNSTVGWGERMQPVKIDVFGAPIYSELSRS
ncbi:hypothetical protein KEM60_02225 [Austwickia sp. TVS 96-490-7B]|uniref:ABC transporter substrate-binding protein n=1 Tax=Austwickia sp. TVS 96-490-7B TaxID=2830843 RepID=UPI001C591DE4|nr:ABC transporter substrate-binding protein [Austwickia sp. TVS 96-490-7B]MBW3086014.1 hypothetical protein [Austwickia sp. TVS 96-490-7B]